jgi:hypothetical protein
LKKYRLTAELGNELERPEIQTKRSINEKFSPYFLLHTNKHACIINFAGTTPMEVKRCLSESRRTIL